ncbi:glycosyltransferase family 2 protein [Mucilaginibacter sp. CSA2-8R]|uniref:glycosyltransferase family 2 protein n=1 Tax=Mucilaginibacter sp. CSA2-8R TaxID=3141542 RepID=UPI00315DF855
MPAYNCERYIGGAIESILKQEFTNFEFIVINDGSSDNTASIIKSYTDPRIRYSENPGNMGIVGTLNRGISMATAPYIARMDADDVSYPERFTLQYQFMESHPEVAVCGAFLKVMDKEEIVRYPEQHDDIFYELLINNVIAHPVVMFRKSIWDKHQLQYQENWFPAEDYMLWVKFAHCGKLHNLQLPLLDYKIHEASISVSKKGLQNQKVTEIKCVHLLDSLKLYNEHNFTILEQALSFRFSDTIAYVHQLNKLFKQIVEANNNLLAFPKENLEKLLSMYWYVACQKALRNGLKVLGVYTSNRLYNTPYFIKLILHYVSGLRKAS